MILENIKNRTIVTQETLSHPELVKKLEEKYDTLKTQNIIINLFSLKEITAQDLNEFLLISRKHKTNKLSFVLVSASVNIDEVHTDLSVTPTLQEAHDFIEMEEIERDLGF